ncbi:MAG: repeat protein [Verrucomicrobia bacterium]|nr:repeat protein [Verrucomicrobiota bacterium]
MVSGFVSPIVRRMIGRSQIIRAALGLLTLSVSARADKAASFAVGGTVRVSVASDGTGPFKYQWKKNGVDIAGATAATYTFANAQVSDSGSYSVSVCNTMGSAISDVAQVGVGQTAPALTAAPATVTVDKGGTTTLSVSVSGSPAPTIQWQLNGVNIPGATGSTLKLSNVSAANAGTYSVLISNALGSVVSTAAIVSVRGTSRLSNVSIRTIPGTGSQTLIAGFVTAGASKSILVRAVGPGLAPYIASPTFADPMLELYEGSDAAPMMTNDNWGGTTELTATFNRLGAFSLTSTSKDAAVLANLAPKVYSAQVKGNGNGLAIAEIYDADTSDSPTGRIVNLSARTQVGTGDGVLVAGFVISGSTPKQLLIRAIGPTLTTYGVPGALADPKLELYAAGTSTVIQSNDNWAGAAELTAAFGVTGAFALTDASSKDASMIVTLNPGAYSAVVSGVGDTTGVALVEIYELP